MNVKIVYVSIALALKGNDFYVYGTLAQESIDQLSTLTNRISRWTHKGDQDIGLLFVSHRSSPLWTQRDTKEFLARVEKMLAELSVAEYYIVMTPGGFSDNEYLRNFQMNFNMPAPRVISR